MENYDFDIFDILKLLLKQKVKLLVFFLLFFTGIFVFQYLTPVKYSIQFIANSSVLHQNEITLKVLQIQNLIQNSADKKLASVFDISESQAESISFVEVTPVKNSSYSVEINMETSDVDLPKIFIQKMKTFIVKDPQLLARSELKKSQLQYALVKLNQELDSLKQFQNFSGVYIQTQTQDLIDLLDKKSAVEADLAFFDFFYVYEGYEIITHELGLRMMILSSTLAAFALAIISVLGLQFFKVFKNKIEA